LIRYLLKYEHPDLIPVAELRKIPVESNPVGETRCSATTYNRKKVGIHPALLNSDGRNARIVGIKSELTRGI
jgi:hypothetical protein